MEAVDTRFALIADNGDKLYPYKKRQITTGRYGFALTKPGEQDRNSQGSYTDSIQEVIRRLVFDGWSVRAKTTDKLGRQREGTFGINKRSIHGYEVSKEFEHIIKSAIRKPLFVSSPQNEKDADVGADIEPRAQVPKSPEENPVDEVTYSAIKSRRGQPEFRKALLIAYSGKCCITWCGVESVLEAAHIVPHTEETNYSVSNGLLLRADIHTLFDLNLIAVDGSGMVIVSKDLQESEYRQFHGKYVAENISESMSSNLRRRFEEYEIIS